MFHVKPAGGAGGNRTPDLCSAIETASGKSGAKSAAFPIWQSRKWGPLARFAGQFSRTIAGRALERIAKAPRWAQAAILIAWLAYQILTPIALAPVIRAEWRLIEAAR